MKTYSHFLMTAIANDGLKSQRIQIHSRALLLGSVIPDLPLLALTLAFVARRAWAGVPAAADPICGPRFNHLYFHNPYWQAGHNLLHAPLVIGLLALAEYRAGPRQQKKWGSALFWFALGAGVHALVDIFTHRDDGPLLLFPLNWSYRLRGPVSYWDPRYGGKFLAFLERLLGLAGSAYLAVTWRRNRKSLNHQETK